MLATVLLTTATSSRHGHNNTRARPRLSQHAVMEMHKHHQGHLHTMLHWYCDSAEKGSPETRMAPACKIRAFKKDFWHTHANEVHVRCPAGRFTSPLQNERRNASHAAQRLRREHTMAASGVQLPPPTAERGCVNQSVHDLYKKEYIKMERAGRDKTSRHTHFAKHPITMHHILVDYCETAKQASDAVCEDEDLLKRYAKNPHSKPGRMKLRKLKPGQKVTWTQKRPVDEAERKRREDFLTAGGYPKEWAKSAAGEVAVPGKGKGKGKGKGARF